MDTAFLMKSRVHTSHRTNYCCLQCRPVFLSNKTPPCLRFSASTLTAKNLIKIILCRKTNREVCENYLPQRTNMRLHPLVLVQTHSFRPNQVQLHRKVRHFSACQEQGLLCQNRAVSCMSTVDGLIAS